MLTSLLNIPFRTVSFKQRLVWLSALSKLKLAADSFPRWQVWSAPQAHQIGGVQCHRWDQRHRPPVHLSATHLASLVHQVALVQAFLGHLLPQVHLKDKAAVPRSRVPVMFWPEALHRLLAVDFETTRPASAVGCPGSLPSVLSVNRLRTLWQASPVCSIRNHKLPVLVTRDLCKWCPPALLFMTPPPQDQDLCLVKQFGMACLDLKAVSRRLPPC